MANSDRKMIRGVRVKGKTYVPGMEDELDALLSADEVKRLSAKGYIEGKWSGSASGAAAPATSTATAAATLPTEPDSTKTAVKKEK